jgi:Baseplate J-like protein
MPITLPNLDDRRYADLVEEARGLLVANAPDLTNHNPSDPVITLTELFAYFTEVLLFRVNNVTDANRVKFLRLLNGPDWPIPTSQADLGAEVRRTVLALRQTDRAVTAADYEFLARAADPVGVARAQCIAERNLDASDPAQRLLPQPGHVSVVIVPSPSADLAAVRATVANYLEPRRLLTARIHVVVPRVVPVGVRVTLRLLPDWKPDQVKQPAIDAIARYLDPIRGRDGTGWPLGRNINVSEIYRLLDTLPGVDFVRRTIAADPSDPIDPTTPKELDELVTKPDFADRVVRNDLGEMIGIALEADELPAFQTTPQIPPPDPADPDTDIVIELPTTTF